MGSSSEEFFDESDNDDDAYEEFPLSRRRSSAALLLRRLTLMEDGLDPNIEELSDEEEQSQRAQLDPNMFADMYGQLMQPTVSAIVTRQRGKTSVNPFNQAAYLLSDNILNTLYNMTSFLFFTWKAESKIIQYIEVEIVEMFDSFRYPFSLVVWQNCRKADFKMTFNTLETLQPVSITTIKDGICAKPIKIPEIKARDVIGVGITFTKNNFYLFGTKNGEILKEVIPIPAPEAFSYARLLLITSSVHRSNQVKVEFIEDNFRFCCNYVEVEKTILSAKEFQTTITW